MARALAFAGATLVAAFAAAYAMELLPAALLEMPVGVVGLFTAASLFLAFSHLRPD